MVADDAGGTVAIHLRERDETFLSTLANPQLGVVPAGTPPRVGPNFRPPGTGPYVIARYVPGKLVIYRRNRRFRVWSQEARPDGIPDTIRWRIDVPRSGGNGHRLNQQLRLVERGEADIAYNTMTARDAVLVQLQHPSQVRLTTFPGGGVWGYWLNTQRGLFTSLIARRAINLAVDRRRFTLLGDPATPTCQITAPGYPGYVPYCPYTRGDARGGVYHGPDIARARRMLRSAGLLHRRVVLVGFVGDPRWEAYDREVARNAGPARVQAGLQALRLRPGRGLRCGRENGGYLGEEIRHLLHLLRGNERDEAPLEACVPEGTDRGSRQSPTGSYPGASQTTESDDESLLVPSVMTLVSFVAPAATPTVAPARSLETPLTAM